MKNPIIILILGIILSGVFYGCSPMDAYLDKYTDGKEIQYPGIVYPAWMYSGKNRVVFNGYLMSDPKIVKIKIYWNSRKDSVEQNIQRSNGVDELLIPIELPEGGYNFEVFTYDGEGNASIPVQLSAASYGASYQESLQDRSLKSIKKESSDVTLEWFSADPTSPFVEITYPTTDGNERTIRVPQNSNQIILENYKEKSVFSMRTLYLPDEMSIDTFSTVAAWIPVNEDVTQEYIRNKGLPFLRGDEDDRKWGTPQNWQFTANVLNQRNSKTDEYAKGGWSTNEGGAIHFESKDYSGDGITNGKIYQTVELPAGKYIFEAYSSLSATTKSSFLDVALVAAQGNELPDMEQLETATLNYYTRQVASGKETYSLEFELADAENVTLGWVASFGKNSSIQFSYVSLFFIPQKQ